MSIDTCGIKPILVKLAEAIEDDISEAPECVETLRTQMSRSDMMQEIEDIEARIAEYDTDGALEKLSQLALALNIQLGEE